MSANNPADKAFMTHVIQAAHFAIALSCGVDKGEILPMAFCLESFLDIYKHVLRDIRTDESACCYYIAVPYDRGRLLTCDNFALMPDLRPEFLENGMCKRFYRFKSSLYFSYGFSPSVFLDNEKRSAPPVTEPVPYTPYLPRRRSDLPGIDWDCHALC